jgi:DUF4097 and DUF4098 domain-containing protein YvlB
MNGTRTRGSIFAGLLLIILGIVFLIDRFDPAFRLGHLIRLYWPLLIILWGVAKLIDHFLLQRDPNSRAPLLSGGEAALLIFLAFVLTGFAFRDWLRDHYPDFDFEPPSLFHESYTQNQDLQPQTVPAGAHVVIETAHGAIKVHTSDSDNLVVHAQKSVRGSTEQGAQGLLKRADVVIETAGNQYRIHPVRQTPLSARVDVDLDVSLPKNVSIEAATGHGNIDVSGISGSAIIRSGSGNINVTGMGSDVSVDLHWGDAKISSVSGNVKITGRGNDLELTNISGDAYAEGAFIGSIHASNIAKTLRWVSPWTNLTVAQLSGHLEADSGDVEVSGATGPAKLITHNKDIKIANVLGRIDIVNTHGDVKVSYAQPPQEDLSVMNDAGDAEITLPAASNFQVSAISRAGEVENEFGSQLLNTSNQDDRGQITGRVGTSGPTISVVTTYGTIHLNKT